MHKIIPKGACRKSSRYCCTCNSQIPAQIYAFKSLAIAFFLGGVPVVSKPREVSLHTDAFLIIADKEMTSEDELGAGTSEQQSCSE